MENLNLATNNELISELFSRFDHILVIGMVERTDSEQYLLRRWGGNSHTLAGLAEDIKFKILVTYYEDEEADDI